MHEVFRAVFHFLLIVQGNAALLDGFLDIGGKGIEILLHFFCFLLIAAMDTIGCGHKITSAVSFDRMKRNMGGNFMDCKKEFPRK